MNTFYAKYYDPQTKRMHILDDWDDAGMIFTRGGIIRPLMWTGLLDAGNSLIFDLDYLHAKSGDEFLIAWDRDDARFRFYGFDSNIYIEEPEEGLQQWIYDNKIKVRGNMYQSTLSEEDQLTVAERATTIMIQDELMKRINVRIEDVGNGYDQTLEIDIRGVKHKTVLEKEADSPLGSMVVDYDDIVDFLDDETLFRIGNLRGLPTYVDAPEMSRDELEDLYMDELSSEIELLALKPKIAAYEAFTTKSTIEKIFAVLFGQV